MIVQIDLEKEDTDPSTWHWVNDPSDEIIDDELTPNEDIDLEKIISQL